MFFFSGKPESAFRPDILFPSNLLHWYRADMGVTSVAGAVSAWANQGSAGGSLAQSTAAKKPATSTLRGQSSLKFDGGDVLVSSLAATNFKFLHNGAGSTIACVSRVSPAASAVMLDTSGSSNLGVNCTGITLYDTSTQSGVTCSKGSVAQLVSQVGRAAQYASTHFHIWRLKTSGSPAESAFYDQGRIFTGAFTGSAAAGDPNYALTVGADAYNNALYLTGKISEIILLDKYITDDELDQLETYFAERYGHSPASGA